MVTLTLKKKPATAKPELIERQPLENITGQYAVMQQKHRSRSMRFTVTHPTLETAKREAQRLSAESPDKRYLIVLVADYVEG
jgi:hypothetical protein